MFATPAVSILTYILDFPYIAICTYFEHTLPRLEEAPQNCASNIRNNLIPAEAVGDFGMGKLTEVRVSGYLLKS